MRPALKEARSRPAAGPYGALPPAMRVLFLAGRQRTGGWLAEAFATDSATSVLLVEVEATAAAVHRLRDEPFDAVLVSHEPGGLDALAAVEVLRTGGSDEPIVILGTDGEAEMAAPSFEVGADAYICVGTATTRSLLWTVSRAMERQRLIAENRRLAQSEKHRLNQDHSEADRLIEQQRALVEGIIAANPTDAAGRSMGGSLPRNGEKCAGGAPLPARLVEHYRELLRAYVMMGSGSLAAEIQALIKLLVQADVSARRAVDMHLQVLNEVVRGLGSRSSRHVMNRADLLAIEILLNLADGYRQVVETRHETIRARLAQGFDATRAGAEANVDELA